MESQPTTPVRLPKATTTYTPVTVDPDLRSQINLILLKEGHVQKISDHLSHSLQSSSTDWPTHIKSHALSLLRSGECTTFPALMERVLADIKAETEVQTQNKAQPSSTEAKNGVVRIKLAAGASSSNGALGGVARGLAVPRAVVDEGLRITRESLEQVCEIDA